MKGYGDFKRIAAVIIPDDADYKERCEKQSEKTVSDNAVNEMKGKFYKTKKKIIAKNSASTLIHH